MLRKQARTIATEVLMHIKTRHEQTFMAGHIEAGINKRKFIK
jgi:hypothetical protein